MNEVNYGIMGSLFFGKSSNSRKNLTLKTKIKKQKTLSYEKQEYIDKLNYQIFIIREIKYLQF